jgi:short-subunit dehydrogenase
MGIGRELAKEFSRRNINTLLIALDTPELPEVKNYIQENYDTKVDTFSADLTEPEAAHSIYRWCQENNYVVKYLINNAGFGDGGYFEAIPLARYCEMIDLNNRAYIAMTHLFLPDLKSLDRRIS